MWIYTAPGDYIKDSLDVTCFLAGGITGCKNWQETTLLYLNSMEKCGIDLSHLVIFNPRREDFPINDPTAAEEQIKWEFDKLNSCDIFSMFFAEGESDQPICMYELGRHLLCEHKAFIIGIEDGYKREQDVLIQTKLATNGSIVPIKHASPLTQAINISQTYLKLIGKSQKIPPLF